ncbi:MAG: flagellar hook-length control protein FliK [Pseudomonadota bacterium]
MSPIMPDMLGVGTAQPRLNLTGAATPMQAQPIANAWKTGEILQAVVLGNNGAGMTKLDINGLEVSAKAPMALAEGDRLELQVMQPGPPPQLRVMQHQGAAQQASIDQALRQALPKGADPQLLARLGDMLKSLGDAPDLPEPQRQALAQLREALPNLRQLVDPTRLEQQVRASGLFLESNLARGELQQGDLKASLLRALASLQSAQAATPQASAPTASQPGAAAQPSLLQQAPATLAQGSPGPASQAVSPPQNPIPNSALQASFSPTGAPPPSATPPQAPSQQTLAIPLDSGNPPQKAAQTQPQTVTLTDGRQGMLDTYRTLAEPGAQHAARGQPATPEHATPAPAASSPAQLADTLRQAVEGALARVHLNQLTSLQSQSGEQPQWVMEFPLPANQADTALRLRLEREGAHQGGAASDAEQGWRLDFDFSMEPLGPLRASVLMRGEHLNVRLWAERPDTLGKLRDHLDLLHAGLQRTGLEIDHLACYPGQGTPRDDDRPRPSGGLLNLSA